jgi:hypothetical protein
VSMPLQPFYSGRAKEGQSKTQVTVVQQGPEENPFTFLQCLKDATRKHTTVDPES